MKKLIVFDLDGTLVDSLPDISAALNHALASLGLPTFTPDECRRKVGNGARKLCERALPAGQEGLLDELLARYNARYLTHCAELTAPYPGIPELLRALHRTGLRTAVISNKPHAQALEVVPHVLGADAPGIILGQRPGIPLKPAPDALLLLIGELGLRPADVLFVGDSPVDIRFGQGAGVDVCGVSWGYADENDIRALSPTFLVRDPAELAALLLA